MRTYGFFSTVPGSGQKKREGILKLGGRGFIAIFPQEPPGPAWPHAPRARVVCGAGRPGHRGMPRRNADFLVLDE